MSKKILFFVVGLLICGSLSAQKRGGTGRGAKSSEDRVTERVEKLSEKIELTDDEKSGLVVIYTKQMETFAQYKESGERPSKEVMQTAREASNVEIKELLGDEKYKEYEVIAAEQQEKMKERGGERGQRGGGGERPSRD